MLVVAFHTFSWPSHQVFGRTWCKHVAPSTHPFHNTTEGQRRLHCRSTHSRLSQAASHSSGIWRQEILPSILHGFHFDIISSFSVKYLSRIFLIRPRMLPSSSGLKWRRRNVGVRAENYTTTQQPRRTLHEQTENAWQQGDERSTDGHMMDEEKGIRNTT
jgi:hypothetical protein